MGAIQRGTSWATIPKTLNHARTVRQRPPTGGGYIFGLFFVMHHDQGLFLVFFQFVGRGAQVSCTAGQCALFWNAHFTILGSVLKDLRERIKDSGIRVLLVTNFLIQVI